MRAGTQYLKDALETRIGNFIVESKKHKDGHAYFVYFYGNEHRRFYAPTDGEPEVNAIYEAWEQVKTEYPEEYAETDVLNVVKSKEI